MSAILLLATFKLEGTFYIAEKLNVRKTYLLGKKYFPDIVDQQCRTVVCQNIQDIKLGSSVLYIEYQCECGNHCNPPPILTYGLAAKKVYFFDARKDGDTQLEHGMISVTFEDDSIQIAEKPTPVDVESISEYIALRKKVVEFDRKQLDILDKFMQN